MLLVRLDWKEVLRRNRDGQLEKHSEQRVTLEKDGETGIQVSWKPLWKYSQTREPGSERVK